jgi:hypothetical protein
MEVGGKRHVPTALPPGKTQYPLHRRMNGSQCRSGQVRKISPPWGFDLRTVQPVTSRYTDYAIARLKSEARHQLQSPTAFHCFHPLVCTISCPSIARRVCMLACSRHVSFGTGERTGCYQLLVNWQHRSNFKARNSCMRLS